MNSYPVHSFELLRRCAICNCGESRLLYRQLFSQLSDGSSLLSGYDVIVCSRCGFCFADQIPPQTVFDTYYRDMSKYEKADRGGQDSTYEKARFQKMASVVLRLLSSRRIRIMEIGCANGQLLALLKNEGYRNVSGIDPSPVSAETARRNYDIPVTAATLSEIDFKDESIDFLIMAGVLEHVRDLVPAIRMLRKMLSAVGQVFVTVPDASRYGEGEDAPFQEFSVEHINFFGAESLANLMQANGFKLVFIEQDMIVSNFRTSTPVIHCVFEKSEEPAPVSFLKDRNTEAGLALYIERSSQADRQIQAAINNLVSAGQPIIIWGTGAHTLRLLATSGLWKAKIRAFVESNPRYQGKQLNNVPIVAPQAIKEWREPILISSRVYQEEIAEQIVNDLHMSNKIIRLYHYDK
jgi:2-polyprenyl-3-methyl-5-hydroxy-6-metoxy-1,4-benzoquinol methylase